MDEIITGTILEIYKKCQVTHFPIDCCRVIETLKIPLVRYSSVNEARRQHYHLISDDSFKFRGMIYYNDLSPHILRQRFSLMHELGHIMLRHTGNSHENEEQADRFSSSILAPRIAIHKMNCRDAQQIHDTFQISYRAANRALADYYKWYNHICRTTRKPSLPEQQMEQWLFSSAAPKPARPEKNQKATAREIRQQERTGFFNEMQHIHGADPMYLHAESKFLYGDKNDKP